jgi:hypothetical protein
LNCDDHHAGLERIGPECRPAARHANRSSNRRWATVSGPPSWAASSSTPPRGNRLRLTGGVIGAYLLVSILHGIWDSMREIALVLTTVVTLASGQSMGIRSGAPDSATDTQILLFNLFNFGGIVVVSALGIVALLIIARRWDRPIRDTMRGSAG